MSKKSLIASITIGSSLLLSSFVGQADQASAMANSGQKVNTSYQQEQQHKALQYNSTKTTTTVSAPVQKTASISKDTYKVVSGDTLSSIASKHGVSYKSIMDKNDLNSTMIYPGQTLTISGAAAPKKAVSNESAQLTTTVSNGNYTVAQGDTLGKIATANNTSVSNLMAVNNLTSTIIYVGQSLKVNGTATATQEAPTSNVVQTSNPVQEKPQPQQATEAPVQGSGGLVAATKAALGQIGVPYVFGGSSTSGFDCSGLIDYALKQGGYNYGRMSAAGYYSLGTSVSTPQYGDLVFFKDTYKAGISHVGFYIGGGQMISASGDQVQIDDIGNSYWKAHFAGYKRF